MSGLGVSAVFLSVSFLERLPKAHLTSLKFTLINLTLLLIVDVFTAKMARFN